MPSKLTYRVKVQGDTATLNENVDASNDVTNVVENNSSSVEESNHPSEDIEEEDDTKNKSGSHQTSDNVSGDNDDYDDEEEDDDEIEDEDDEEYVDDDEDYDFDDDNEEDDDDEETNLRNYITVPLVSPTHNGLMQRQIQQQQIQQQQMMMMMAIHQEKYNAKDIMSHYKDQYQFQKDQQQQQQRQTSSIAKGRQIHRFPCPIRNMGNDHNASTAYITIPPQTRHGEFLECSHKNCASNETQTQQLRYCTVCEIPVASKIFLTRHRHDHLPPPQEEHMVQQPPSSTTCLLSPPRSRNSRTRYIPCIARGMGEDHNAETARIAIVKGTCHGQLLTCSHEECTMKGVRFRYCAICDVPVAKRNFPKIHGHHYPFVSC